MGHLVQTLQGVQSTKPKSVKAKSPIPEVMMTPIKNSHRSSSMKYISMWHQLDKWHLSANSTYTMQIGTPLVHIVETNTL